MNPLSRFLRHYLLALQFFTRIPVTGPLAVWVGFSPDMLRASAGHFPGVGWLVGGLLAGLSWLLLLLLPETPLAPLVVAVLGTAAGVLLTGAFHEDGLADVADGLGGALGRERALLIMKDSRVGAFGAIAVALALLCKVALLALLGSISSELMCLALFLGHVVSRTWPLLLIRFMTHVGDLAGSKSKPLAETLSLGGLCTGLLWCWLALALAVFGAEASDFSATDEDLLALSLSILGGLMASALAFVVMARWFWRRLQGFTGDCLGATQQVCELAFYLGLALAL
jgi:adenosylcobinamide-GDP ribazoletransferase